ncbi:hypothetical protein KEM56_001962, partial [Ascosphaera pollenicola]
VDKPDEKQHWEKLITIKQLILSRWNSSPTDVKLCCIKFAQKIVSVQTIGPIADPRRPEQNETSLAIVPRNHPVLQLSSLQAESSGLLDRLLDIFYENSSDPIIVNATLNCLAGLMRTRQAVSSKILNAIMNYNPIAAAMDAHVHITPALKVKMKSIERTTRALLLNFIKRNPGHPMNTKLHHCIERMAMAKIELLEEGPRKRAAPTEPTDVVDSAKRARLGVETPPAFKIPPMPAGPNSIAQLFTLTEDQELSKFDVTQLPVDMLVNMTVLLLARVENNAMEHTINAVRSRYEELSKRRIYESLNPKSAEEEDDDYEPEYDPAELPFEPASPDGGANENGEVTPEIALGPFVLPQPAPLSGQQATDLGKDTVQRILGMMSSLEQPSRPVAGPKSTQKTSGFGRLAASSFDRDSWATVLTRLATRGTLGLETPDPATGKSKVADTIRERLHRYVLEDFRGRIGIAIGWMNEEWYADKVGGNAILKNTEQNDGQSDGDPPHQPNHYATWAVKMLEGFLPYLDAKDLKVLIRYLSEIPELNDQLIAKVKSLANDPERVALCVRAFHYLVLYRPPVRKVCLDALESVYHDVPESRPLMTSIVKKWRPELLQEAAPQEPNQTATLEATAASS